MEAIFGRETNDPETAVGCIAEMKLTVVSEMGERIKTIREGVMRAMESEAVDFIRLYQFGRLPGGASCVQTHLREGGGAKWYCIYSLNLRS